MTEEEAKTKECCGSPHIATVLSGLAYAQAGLKAPDDLTGLCIASACMAWRWEKTMDGPSETVGFCGLAGTPQ